MNEGARLLSSVHGSTQLIGDAIGASKQAVSTWRTGVRVPDEVWRHKLHAQYAIPLDAWDRVPHSASENRESITDAPVPAAPWFPITGAEPSALEDCTRLLGLLRAQLNRPDLLGRERVQLGDAFSRALVQKERIEKARETLESRTIREHPQWQRLKRYVIAALLPHPAASKAVESALLHALDEQEPAALVG